MVWTRREKMMGILGEMWNCQERGNGGLKEGRPIWMQDAAKEDMAVVEVTQEHAEDRNKWRWRFSCGDPCREKSKEDEVQIYRVNCMREYSHSHLP